MTENAKRQEVSCRRQSALEIAASLRGKPRAQGSRAVIEETKMNRVRTLIAAALLTIPMLTVSAASPADQSTQVMRDGSLPAPQTGYCFFYAGHLICF
jgi:hypothetical protein